MDAPQPTMTDAEIADWERRLKAGELFIMSRCRKCGEALFYLKVRMGVLWVCHNCGWSVRR